MLVDICNIYDFNSAHGSQPQSPIRIVQIACAAVAAGRLVMLARYVHFIWMTETAESACVPCSCICAREYYMYTLYIICLPVCDTSHSRVKVICFVYVCVLYGERVYCLAPSLCGPCHLLAAEDLVDSHLFSICEVFFSLCSCVCVCVCILNATLFFDVIGIWTKLNWFGWP